MSAEKEYVVFLFGWNLVPLESLVERIADMKGLPKHYMHVGVGVHNQLHHFTQSGISSSMNMPKQYLILSRSQDNLKYFLTKKTASELNTYLLNIRGKYAPGTYKVNTNNCICFAREIFNFLGLGNEFERGPFDHWILEDWLKNNSIIESVTSLYRSLGISGSSSNWAGSADSFIDVFAEVSGLVSKTMEKEYRVSASGGRYNLTDGSADN